MTPNNDKITQRQFIGLCFVALLSTIIHRLPQVLAQTAGYTAYLAPLIAIVPVFALLGFFLFAYKKADGRSLHELVLASIGKYPGKVLVAIYCIWLVAYAGFLLRSGAERFIVTIYPNSSHILFIIGMGVLCLFGALGQFKSLARSAMLFRPLLLGVFIIVLALAVKSVDLKGDLAVTAQQLPSSLLASVVVANCFSTAVFLAFGFENAAARPKAAPFCAWSIVTLLIIEVLCITTIGTFGAEMSAKLNHPFFLLVRNTTLFGAIDRIEALIIALWVFADFVLISSLLHIASHNLRKCFGCSEDTEKPRLFDMRRGRFITVLCCAAACAVGIAIAPTAFSLEVLTAKIVPGVNLVLAFIVLPPILLIGKLRKKI
ncbi:MAG: GerAB/ArcD/ProY family transporter [Oscillospiraceae bacterium]|nr:GerAB/ArcD/ProY family transporter [Oscillospiraceae bacterium]